LTTLTKDRPPTSREAREIDSRLPGTAFRNIPSVWCYKSNYDSYQMGIRYEFYLRSIQFR